MTSQNKQSDDQVSVLLETVERLRKERFPGLDATLVRDLLRLHADPANEGTVARLVEQAVEQALAKVK